MAVGPQTALTCIAVVHSWKGFGWGFIMLLAGLQTIDRQLYEAAQVDGAGAWHTFRNVTIPMMLPVIVVVVILTILGAMQSFVLILSMVGQGLVYHTEVPVTRILASMTGTQRFGYACAQGVTFGAILVAISFILNKLSSKSEMARDKTMEKLKPKDRPRANDAGDIEPLPDQALLKSMVIHFFWRRSR